MILSKKVLNANYLWGDCEMWGDCEYIAKPASMCKTESLSREYFELENAWESGLGDDEAIEKRMEEIRKELSKRGDAK